MKLELVKLETVQQPKRQAIELEDIRNCFFAGQLPGPHRAYLGIWVEADQRQRIVEIEWCTDGPTLKIQNTAFKANNLDVEDFYKRCELFRVIQDWTFFAELASALGKVGPIGCEKGV